MKPKLSVVVITLNEVTAIRRCLDSVAFADEIIVVDSGSTDGTVDIARTFTDKVYLTDWPGFGAQKNRALSFATGDWVLSIDADEWLSESLAQEIQAVVEMNADVAYTLPRRSSYLGRMIRYGHWRNDKVCRLFKREFGHFTDDKVHEKLLVQHPVETLNAMLLHESFETHEDVLNKMNQYSSLAAQMRVEQNRQATFGKALRHGLWAFVYSYFIKLGLLDGSRGLMLAISFAEGTYYKYVKMLQLQEADA